MEKDYLIRRRPIAALLIFALPMMLGNFFQQLYTMADSAIVGRLVGEEALAAVGASYSLTNVFISIAIGGGVGASVITRPDLWPPGFFPDEALGVHGAAVVLGHQPSAGRGGPGLEPADYGAPPHPGEHPG